VAVVEPELVGLDLVVSVAMVLAEVVASNKKSVLLMKCGIMFYTQLPLWLRVLLHAAAELSSTLW